MDICLRTNHKLLRQLFFVFAHVCSDVCWSILPVSGDGRWRLGCVDDTRRYVNDDCRPKLTIITNGDPTLRC